MRSMSCHLPTVLEAFPRELGCAGSSRETSGHPAWHMHPGKSLMVARVMIISSPEWKSSKKVIPEWLFTFEPLAASTVRQPCLIDRRLPLFEDSPLTNIVVITCFELIWLHHIEWYYIHHIIKFWLFCRSCSKHQFWHMAISWELMSKIHLEIQILWWCGPSGKKTRSRRLIIWWLVTEDTGEAQIRSTF